MKTTQTIFIATLILTLFTISIGQTPEQCKAALDNYYNALNSDNQGLLESAIERVVKLKMYSPGMDYAQIQEKLNELMDNGPTDVIKYKSFIAVLYIENPARFTWISATQDSSKITTIDEIFARIENQITDK
jgi:hypothetical protein